MANLIKKYKNMPVEVRASVAYTFCNVIQKSLTFLTLPLFTRLLTTTQYGQYSIYTSWSALLTIFVTLNLSAGTFSTAMVKYENQRDQYISVAQTVCTVLAIIFLCIYLPFRKFFYSIFELPTEMMVLMVAELIATTSFQFWSGKKRFEYKYRIIVIVTVFMAIISPITALTLVLHAGERGYARIFGYAIITILVGGTLYVWNYIKGKKLFIKEYWKYALAFNGPLIIYYLSQVIFNQSDRLMINYYCGTSKAGIYGVAHQLALVLNFVLVAINGAYIPWMYEQIKIKKYKSNVKVSLLISSLLAILLLGIIWLTPEIILFFGGEKYHEAIWVVPPISMSLILLFYAQLFINLQFYYEEKTKLIAGSVGAALINVVLNALFIPRFGYYVAGYTTLFAYIVFAVSNYYIIKDMCKNTPQVLGLYNIKALIVLCVSFMWLGFLGMVFYNWLSVRLSIIVIVLSVMGVFHKRILTELKPILRKKSWD